MARCIRRGRSYKRHQFNASVCKACGAKQITKATK